MALRVLLADESVTIKKVIQLALQDFAVEVKAVPVGVDVLDVTKSFKPDLVFADILLQKRSGYDVCRDLKRDPETAALPVVLMWSSFMELDQTQLEVAGADGRLEKPFDVETLRRLVLELVPRTRSQRMAHFLDFPATIAAPLRSEESEKAHRQPAKPVSQRAANPSRDFESPVASDLTPVVPERPGTRREEPVPPTKEEPLGALPDLQFSGASSWNMESFEPLPSFDLEGRSTSAENDDEADAFQPIQLPNQSAAKNDGDEAVAFSLDDDETPFAGSPFLTATGDDKDDDDDDHEAWAPQSLDKYKVAPLSTEESLAIDDETPLVPAPRPEPPAEPRVELRPEARHTLQPEEISEFSLDDDLDKTLEIEPISAEELTRPAIVRQLLRDPDFNSSPSPDLSRTEVNPPPSPFDPDITQKIPPATQTFLRDPMAAVDLSAAGRPQPATSVWSKAVDPGLPSETLNQQGLDALLRSQIEPALEAVVERLVTQLLPQIAERIISRELQKLLEDTEK